MSRTWAVGITTVPERRNTTLARTLRSLMDAGFPELRLFVDGTNKGGEWPANCTLRYPRVGPFGNWYMAAVELLVRFPASERYAIFQDDLVCVRGLREYLDNCAFPKRGYWNLFTFLDGDNVISDRGGWVEGPTENMASDPNSNKQTGRGALGLVFSREGLQTLVGSRHMAVKPSTHDHPRDKIDGAVVEAMNLAGYREFVHGPSLLLHTGTLTSIQEGGKAGKVWKSNAQSFPGENVDIRAWMRHTHQA